MIRPGRHSTALRFSTGPTSRRRLTDALGLGRLSVVGHHTRAVIMAETAAACPDRIGAAVPLPDQMPERFTELLKDFRPD